MNLNLAATFQVLTSDLMTVWGRTVTHTTTAGDESPVLAVIGEETAAVGDYGERTEQRWTLELASTSGAAVGDTFTEAGTVTSDDPTPDDVVWIAAQLISDDGFTRKFAARRGAV